MRQLYYISSYIIIFESTTCGTAATVDSAGQRPTQCTNLECWPQHRVMCELQWSGAVVFMKSEWPEKPACSLKTNREKTESTLWQQHLMSHRVAKGNILLYKTVIFNSLEFIRYAKGVVTHLTIGVTSLLTAERCWKPLQTHFAMKQNAYFRIKASMMWFIQVEHIPELTCFVGTTLLSIYPKCWKDLKQLL